MGEEKRPPKSDDPGASGVAEGTFQVSARVSTESPAPVREALRAFLPPGARVREEGPGEFEVEGQLTGPSARDVNRALLNALRRAERRTRLRSQWTHDGVTERFFNYVPKGTTSVRPGTTLPVDKTGPEKGSRRQGR